jgi:molecular chaperone Hsp33
MEKNLNRYVIYKKEFKKMDYIYRGSLVDFPIRFFIGDTTNTIEDMRKIHNTTATASAASGRILTASALMSFILKNDNDKLSIIVDGDGEIGRIISTTDINANVKCDIKNPIIDLMVNNKGKLDVAKAVGKGIMTITYDNGFKEPYSGMIELVTSEIGDDLTNYFLKSEQIPSVVGLGVLVDKDSSIKRSGGFIIQVMPNCDEEIIDYIENKISNIKSVTNLFDEAGSKEEILNNIFGDYKYKITEKKELNYNCDCSKKKVEKALVAVGKKELQNLLESDEKIEVKCHFCNTLYKFTKNDIREIINTSK